MDKQGQMKGNKEKQEWYRNHKDKQGQTCVNKDKQGWAEKKRMNNNEQG